MVLHAIQVVLHLLVDGGLDVLAQLAQSVHLEVDRVHSQETDELAGGGEKKGGKHSNRGKRT